MTWDDVRAETVRRLTEIDPDLGRDEVEVERQLEDVRSRMMAEAEHASKHYARISEEALTRRYKDLYAAQAENSRLKLNALLNLPPR